MKTCTHCGESKPLTEYNKKLDRRQKAPNRIRSECKGCQYIVGVKDTLRRTYGLSWEDFEEMFKSQGGKCAICHDKIYKFNKNKSKRRCTVDHCHETGQVRGLLCLHCNTVLGYSKDNTEILANAIAYLNKERAE